MNAWERWLEEARSTMSLRVAGHVNVAGSRNERCLYALRVFFLGVQADGNHTVDRAIEAHGFPGRPGDMHPDEFVPGMLALIESSHAHYAKYAAA
jgi:hypothetical protein